MIFKRKKKDFFKLMNNSIHGKTTKKKMNFAMEKDFFETGE